MGKFRRFAITFKVTIIAFDDDEDEAVRRAMEKVGGLGCVRGYATQDAADRADSSYADKIVLDSVEVIVSTTE